MPQVISHFDYVMELLRTETHEVLRTSPMQVDWDPLVQTMEFELIRQGHLSGFGHLASVSIEPEWALRGRGPHIRAVRVLGEPGGDSPHSLVVGLDYFRLHAQTAASQCMKTGQLQEGDTYEYRIRALRRQKSCASSLIKLEATDLPLAIGSAPLAGFMGRALLMGAFDAADMPAFVHWQVVEEAAAQTRLAGDLETGGILLGYLHRDPEMCAIFLEITAQVPARLAKSQLTRLCFGPETWSDVQAAVARRGRGELWLGWWHSHSFFDAEKKASAEAEAKAADSPQPFFSTDDCLLHRTVFPRAYSVALLVTDSPKQSGMSWTMFGWQSARIAQRGFHLVDVPLPKAFSA